MEALRSRPVIFRRWSNKKWAVLASFHKVILIGTLCFSYQLLAQDSLSSVTDKGQVQILVELEEVKTTEEWPAQLEEVSLKPVILITSKEINAAAATSFEEILEYLPQLDIRQRGRHGVQADLSIMGGSFDQSMVLLNGINISDPQTGHFHLNIPLDLHSVKQIEIVTGASARRYGSNAFSGAINLLTHPVDSTYLNAGFRYGQHSFYKAHLLTNLGGGKISTQISLNTAASDGYSENTDFRTTHLFLHSVSKPGSLRLHLMAGMNSRAFGANGFYSPRFLHQYEETSTGVGALKLVKKRLNSTWTLTSFLRLGRDHFLLDRHNPDFYTNDHLTTVGGLEISGKISTAAGLTRTGLNYRREGIISTSLGEPREQARWIQFKDTITFTHGHVRNHFNWHINHSYEWGPFSFSGGMLAHLNPDLGPVPRVYPGMDLKWRLLDLFSIYFSVNQSMRLPTFTDLYYQGPSNVGNPLLVPERATTFELGIFHADQDFNASMNAFFRKGKEMIDWIWMDDEKWHTMNLTRVNALGGDIQLDYKNSKPHTAIIRTESAILSYTFTHLTKVSHEFNSRYLLDNLRHKVVAGTELSFYQKLRLSIKASYQERNGSYLAYDAETSQSLNKPYESFVLLDAKLSFSIRRFGLFVETTNILDTKYNDIGNVIQPGRWFIAGFEIR
jgi:vitamin B12 transporter